MCWKYVLPHFLPNLVTKLVIHIAATVSLGLPVMDSCGIIGIHIHDLFSDISISDILLYDVILHFYMLSIRV